MTNVRPEDLAAVYLQGWSASTLRVYTAAFKDIVRYGGVFGKHWYRWNSGDVTSYLINGSALTPNSIKKLGAVMSLLFGCCDRPSPAVGPLVNKVKVGVLKCDNFKAGSQASLDSREYVDFCHHPVSSK